MFPKIPEASQWFSGKTIYQKPNEDERHLLQNFPLPISQLTHGNTGEKKKNYNVSTAGMLEPASTQGIDFNRAKFYSFLLFLLLHFEIIQGIHIDTYLISKRLYLELEAESNFSNTGLDPRIYVKNKREFFRFQHSSHRF